MKLLKTQLIQILAVVLLLKTLLNGNRSPCIFDLFDGIKYIVDFYEKCKILESFFLINVFEFQMVMSSYRLNFHDRLIAQYYLVILQKMTLK